MTFARRLVFLAGLCCCPTISCMTAAQASEDKSSQSLKVASQTDVASPSPGPERLELGIAADSEEGLIGSVYVGKNNLIPGVFTFATFRNTGETRRAQAGLFKHDACGPNIDAGLDLNHRRDAYDDQGYRQSNMSVEPYLQFRTGHWGTVTTGLGYRWVTLDGIATDASPSIHRDEGTDRGLYARVSWTLPDVMTTSRFGMSVGMDGHVYNLDSSSRAFLQTEGWTRTKLALIPDDLSLLNVVRVGYMHGLDGEPVSLADRFFIGGARLRGFEVRHVGPRVGNYFVGGERYATASLDLVKKVGTLWGSQVSVGAFVDVGTLWGVGSQTDAQDGNRAAIRVSTGLAVTFAVAGVPVSLYVAKPVRKEPQDSEQNFGVSVSMRF
ncbi:BamA/TamA family outer membrane protein [Burkholderia pyrrocinia]|uniref:BamA/TamA family outer membrane protein n=1 Tax=Burkholderia pyrrocinia TaxID=60550 RepID=UPI002AAF7D04|nr:BamA/TamA family outer membrane protein [Burkholderia pyrrocinia]